MPRFVVPLVFLALAFALYGNALGNGLVFDDDIIVTSHYDLGSVEGVKTLLETRYRPVRHLSFALDHALWGRHAWGFHLSNVLYHALACALVFRVVRRLAGERAAWAAALLFAIHPVQTEAVAYVSGRRDILVTIFFLLGFLSYLTYRDTGRRRHILALLGWLALGAGTKESAVTLPAVLLLYDLIVGPKPLGRRLLFHAPFLLLAAVFAVRVATGDASQQEGFHGGSALTHYLAVPCLYGLYLWRFVMPVRLLADYSLDAFPLPRSPLAPSFLGATLALSALVAATFLLRRRVPLVAFGIAWFLVTLLPVVQIIPFHELAAEHHLYLASVGLCLAAGVAFEHVPRRRVALPAGVALLLALSVRTVLRNEDWKDAETLWAVTARDAPRCARAQFNAGYLKALRGAYDEALPQLRAAVEIRGDARDRYGLACALLALGRNIEAQMELELALAEARAQRNPPVSPGAILMARGRPKDLEEALREFDNDVRTHPWTVRPLYNKGLCYEALGDDDAALREYEKLLARAPGDYPTLVRVADLMEKRGDIPRAAAFRARARERAPLGE